MSYHSTDGRHFLGWRLNPRGRIEVIYDCADGERQVFEVTLPRQGDEADVTVALKTAVAGRNVLASLYTELTARDIGIERKQACA